MVENTAMRLKRIMKERNLRQVDIIRLAEPYCIDYNLKLTKSDMSQFISGKVEPGSWKLTILGKALNVSEAWLMGYDVPMERRSSQNASGTSAEDIARRILNLSPENRARILERLRVLEEIEASNAGAQD